MFNLKLYSLNIQQLNSQKRLGGYCFSCCSGYHCHWIYFSSVKSAAPCLLVPIIALHLTMVRPTVAET